MSYNAESIKIRNFREAVRATPSMYLGDSRQNGIFNSFLEILNNAVDEAIMKRGNIIEVSMGNDWIQIRDEGAGIPCGPNKDCEEVLIELFTTAHSSGKFDTNNYKKVRGLHGVGSSAVCMCCENFEVWTNREGYTWYLQFIDGVPQSEKAIKQAPTKKTGTTIKFKPNKKIFGLEQCEDCFDYDRIFGELELTSYFVPNVKFSLTYRDLTVNFLSENGLKDFAASRIKKPLHKNFIYGYKEFDDEVEVEVFAQWTAGKEKCYVFSNGALNSEGGTPISGAKTAFTRTINSLSKQSFNSDMIRKGLVYIINIRHPHPIYQNQIKNRIQNPELNGYTQRVFGEAIKEFNTKHKEEFNKIIEILQKDQKAEAAAERARQKILNNEKEQLKTQKNKFINLNKISDARTLGPDSILILCEGISAGGSMKIGRDVNRYGILPLRGKCKNLLNCTIEEGLENEEVKLFQQALGVVYGKKNNNLRYGKVAIASDGDFDGSHIGLLIMAMSYIICPSLLTENKLYWLKAPIYKVATGKKNYYYYSEEEFINHPTGTITKYKGLGEMQEADLKESMFNDEWQHLEPIEFSEEGLSLLKNLMGTNIDFRKEFVYNNIDFNNFVIE